MSDSVQIALIVVGGIVVLGGIALFLLKDNIGSASVRGSKKGVSVDVKTHQPTPTRISGTKIKGKDNVLTAKNGGQIDKSDIEGDTNKLDSGNT